MAQDLATLSLSLTNAPAIAAAKATGAAFDEMGAKGEAAARKIAASSNPVTTAIKQQAIDYTQLTARASDFARAGASAAQVSQMAGVSMAQAAAAVKAYSGTVSKAEIDVVGLKAAQAQLALANMAVGESAAVAGAAFSLSGAHAGRLREGLASMVSMMTGIPPLATRIASTIGVMTVGMSLVLPALLAIGASAWVFDKLTESSRKAMEVGDKLVETYNQAARIGALGISGQQKADIEDINKSLEQHAKWLGVLIQLRTRLGALGGLVFGIGGHEEAIGAGVNARASAQQQAVNELGLQNAKDNEAWAKRIKDEKKAADAILRKAEEEALAASKHYWEGQHELVVRAMAMVAEIREIGRTYLRDNPLLPMVNAQIMEDFDKYRKVTMPTVGLNDGLTPQQIKQRRAMGINLEGAPGGLESALGSTIPSAASFGLGIASTTISNLLQPLAQSVADFASNLLDGGRAAREAAAAMKYMQEQARLSAQAFHFQATGNSMESELTQQRQAYAAQVKQLHDLVWDPETVALLGNQHAALQQAAKDEAQAEATIRTRHAREAQQAPEDLQVRLLAAQGQEKAAAALKLQHDQARERQTLIDSFGPEIDATEQATLALLDQVQAQEKLKAATDAATGSALNMVAGYRLQATIFEAMNPRGASGKIPKQWPGFVSPSGIPGPTPLPSTPGYGDLTVNVVMPDGTVIGKAVLKDFKGRAQKQFGDSTKWSSIQ